MQNRYAGDVGDFGKFSLLRTLFGSDQYQLGVVWYLYPNENHNGDGKHIDYLNKQDYKKCDSFLCNELSKVVKGERSVQALERATLLPKTTKYFSAKLDFHIKYPSQTQKDKSSRKMLRERWLDSAVCSIENCNVVFLDPDNGLQIDSCPTTSQKKAGKYAFYDEVKALCKGKDVCVIYHHLNRHKNHGTHENQIQSRARELLKEIGSKNSIFALRYKPYSPRAYFILTNSKSAVSIKKSIQGFMASPCGALWDSFFEGNA